MKYFQHLWPFYPHLPIGKVWIYRLLFVFFVCLFIGLFVRLWISPPRIKLAASNFAWWLIGVLGRESPIFCGTLLPGIPKLDHRERAHPDVTISVDVKFALEMSRSWYIARCVDVGSACVDSQPPNSNGIPIGLVCFAGLTNVTNRHTDHAPPSVAVSRILCTECMRCGRKLLFLVHSRKLAATSSCVMNSDGLNSSSDGYISCLHDICNFC